MGRIRKCCETISELIPSEVEVYQNLFRTHHVQMDMIPPATNTKVIKPISISIVSKAFKAQVNPLIDDVLSAHERHFQM